MAPPQPEPSLAPAKSALRDQLLAARSRRPLAELAEDARRIGELAMDLDEVRRAATVAAYVSTGTEPGTGRLLDRLRAAGKRVLLPVLARPDPGRTELASQATGWDLDWAAYTGPAGLATARFGLFEPTGDRSGPAAVGVADVVFVPGLAVSDTGLRIGRGGGCYDRALPRVAADAFVCVLLYDDEVGREVPAEPHDRPVSAALSPGGLVRF
ncbi:MAG: 5-formyltetrahydrofolate cyclo-ligase [Nocardioides sp.]